MSHQHSLNNLTNKLTAQNKNKVLHNQANKSALSMAAHDPHRHNTSIHWFTQIHIYTQKSALARSKENGLRKLTA